MRLFKNLPAALLSALLGAGCGTGSAEPGGPPATQAPAALVDRVEKALAIADAKERDTALAAAARDASDAGATDQVMKALAGMKSQAEHDTAAADCATRLSAVGKGYDAEFIAHTITNAGTRDKLLAKLAKDKPSS